VRLLKARKAVFRWFGAGQNSEKPVGLVARQDGSADQAETLNSASEDTMLPVEEVSMPGSGRLMAMLRRRGSSQMSITLRNTLEVIGEEDKVEAKQDEERPESSPSPLEAPDDDKPPTTGERVNEATQTVPPRHRSSFASSWASLSSLAAFKNFTRRLSASSANHLDVPEEDVADAPVDENPGEYLDEGAARNAEDCMDKDAEQVEVMKQTRKSSIFSLDWGTLRVLDMDYEIRKKGTVQFAQQEQDNEADEKSDISDRPRVKRTAFERGVSVGDEKCDR